MAVGIIRMLTASSLTNRSPVRRAADARREVAAGGNPIESRDASRKAEKGRKTFGECTIALFTAKQVEWRSAKHRRQWRLMLETHAVPNIWAMPVQDIGTEAVLSVLRPLWQTRTETASRLRGRIEATLPGLRQGENPARWRGHLDKLLPKRQKLSRNHFAAMPYAEVPAFMAALREREAMTALLEFLILTAASSGEVLGARWDEINLGAKVWTVPASRMKGGREHRVPLSGRAMAILARLAEAKISEFIFPGQRPGKPLSATSIEMVMRRMKADGATVLGLDRLLQRLGAALALAKPPKRIAEIHLRRGPVLRKFAPRPQLDKVAIAPNSREQSLVVAKFIPLLIESEAICNVTR
jgi:integrase